MEIYITQAGQSFGPFFIEQVIQFFYYERSIAPNDLIWYPGLSDWMSVAEFFRVRPISYSPPETTIDYPSTAERLVAKREQLQRIVLELQQIVQSRNEQRLQNRLDELAKSSNKSLWFKQTQANLSVELKHQNLATLRQIAEYERQISELDRLLQGT